MKKIAFLVSIMFLMINSIVAGFIDNTVIGNEESNVTVKTSKNIYIENEKITVNFSGMPGNSTDWITLIKPEAPASEYGNWKYTKGLKTGSLVFNGMSVGKYEVRVFFKNGSTIQARYPFEVIKSSKQPTIEESIDNSPARNQITSVTERLDKLEELKNSLDWGNRYEIDTYTSLLKTIPIHIKNVRSMDPAFDISAFEKRLNEYQMFYDNNAKKEAGKNLEKADFEKLVTDKSWKLSYLLDDKIGSGSDWVHSYYNTANYLLKAKEVEYPQLLSTTIEGEAKFKDASFDYKVQTIKGFGAEYKTYFHESLQSVINGLIESAYANKSVDALEAVKYAEQAKQLNKAALLILPNDPQVIALNKDAVSCYNDITGQVFAAVYTSDFHKENVGEIVFFTEKPIIKQERTSTVSENFQAGDYIYAMAYLKGSLKELTKARNDIKLKISLSANGNTITTYEFRLNWDYLNEGKTYLYLELVPDPKSNEHSGPATYAKALANLSPRNHSIKVTIDGLQVGTSHLHQIAEGEFKLDCSSGQDKLSNYALLYREKNLASVYMPKAKMSNSNLEQSMKKALQEEGWEKNKKVQKVKITGSSWTTYKHPVSGAILYRSIPAAVAFKTNDGECKYWNLTFKQEYKGSAYGKTIVGGVGSIVDMSCGNVLK